MRNQSGPSPRHSSSASSGLCVRPTLDLQMDQPVSVDMERFFEFSFSFAEALLDLEAKYRLPVPVTTLQRHLALATSGKDHEPEFDIDVRWM